MDQYTLEVEGMSCSGCEERVTTAVTRIDDVYRIEADHETGTVDVTAEADTEEQVRRTIHDAGYDLPA